VEELQQAQAQGKTLVVPVVQEEANVTRVVHTNRVEIAKTVHERMETVDEPLLSEEVEIERVTINRPLKSASISLGDGKAAAMEESQAAQVRREGDVLIIPLVEEVLVVEKRLVLREEVRIRKVQRETHAPQEVKLRNEQVEITRTPDTQTSSEDRPSKRTH
jgi:stress response protein YsnF